LDLKDLGEGEEFDEGEDGEGKGLFVVRLLMEPFDDGHSLFQ